MKTPASNHLHGLSVSSQPSSTPLQPGAIHDELLNLNSPAAALINSIAQNNLTPLPMGHQEGLGITGHTPLSTRDGPRNPEMERLNRLQQALDMLKSKVVGRSVTRDGIKRVAQLHGLEAVDIDDDNLVIAGENIVEMEITFDSKERNNVQELSLKLNYDGEGHVQKDATEMLKAQAATDASVSDLKHFAHNIEYLAQLEKIDVKPNCFQLVSNLSACLQDIWKEEKKRMHWRNELHHLRKGAVGMPMMDRAPRLGLGFAYWQRETGKEAEIKSEQSSTDGISSSNDDQWRATISCESGLPMMMSSKDWLKSDILTEAQPGQNVLDAKDHVFFPDWRDSLAGLAIKTDDPKDETSMDVDKKSTELPKQLDVHFTCTLEPAVLVPLPLLQTLNSEIQMIEIDPRKAVTYNQTLQRKRNNVTRTSADTVIEERWKRRLPYVDRKGKLTWHNQSCKLYSSNEDTESWCYPISRLRFNHPRQVAELLPALRMHIVVWTLLESIVLHPPPSEASGASKPRVKGQIVRRSNRPSQSEDSIDSALSIDIMLDFMSSPNKTTMEINAPLRSHQSGSKTTRSSMLGLVVQIGLNGVIEVSDLSGVKKASDSDEAASLRAKVGKLLTATEDLGVVVQWLVQSRTG